MPCDDLNTVLNAVGFYLSRKVFSSLVGSLPESNSDRVNYREFQEPETILSRKVCYPTVSQRASDTTGQPLSDSASELLIVERNSTQYNIDELIKQSEEDQKIKVRLNEQLSVSINKTCKIRSFSGKKKLSNLGFFQLN